VSERTSLKANALPRMMRARRRAIPVVSAMDMSGTPDVVLTCYY
jgi:hypothetical protein